MATTEKQVTCYGLYRTHSGQQEWYETAGRDAGRRARQLRAIGLNVYVTPMGFQVTRAGRVKLTLVTVYFKDPMNPPSIPRPARVLEI